MLVDGQVQVGSLVMGPGTPYRVLAFNPYSRDTRADQGGPRPWGDGSWSGAEWTAEAVVPLTVRVYGSTPADWMANRNALAAAFAASHEDVELRWAFGGQEYVMFGRPRVVDPDVKALRIGAVNTRLAFVAIDPAIYSSEERTVSLRLPSTSGGLRVPLRLPVTVPATFTAGRVSVVNAGTRATPLRLRIWGPVPGPRVAVTAGGTTQTLLCWLELDEAQWLDVDTGNRTAYLNGVASRRGLVSGDWPTLPPSAAADIAFGADTYNPTARLDVTWRDAWH